jgi:hypothetical protein
MTLPHLLREASRYLSSIGVKPYGKSLRRVRNRFARGANRTAGLLFLDFGNYAVHGRVSCSNHGDTIQGKTTRKLDNRILWA